MPTPRYTHAIGWWFAQEMDYTWAGDGQSRRWSRIDHPRLLLDKGCIVSRPRWGSGNGMELVRTLRDPNNKIRCFLLNGDMADTQTERGQQRVARFVLQRTGVPCIIVPYQALATAGIALETIRPIDITADRFEEIPHYTRPYKEEEIVWKQHRTAFNYQTGKIPGRPELTFSRHTHQQRWENNRYTYEPIEHPVTIALLRGRRISNELAPDGRLVATEGRHRLGDSVFSACLTGERKRRKFVSSFDYNERWPLYFLAELPSGARVKSVEDAILALAPPIVHAAIAQGRDVKRQGDMFAIPTELTTKEVGLLTGSKIQKMQGIFGTDHIVTESVVGANRVTYGRGFIHHLPPGRRPDHRRVELEKVWHLMVPNTVPRRRRRGATARV